MSHSENSQNLTIRGKKKSPVCFPRFHGDTDRVYAALRPGLISKEGLPLTTDRSVTACMYKHTGQRGGKSYYLLETTQKVNTDETDKQRDTFNSALIF